MEVDDLTFEIAVPEKLRALVEEQGRIKLSDTQATALARTKPVHIALVTSAVLGAVAWGGAGYVLGVVGYWAAMFFPFFAFGFGKSVDAFGSGHTTAEIAKEITSTLGKMMLGFVVFFAAFALSQS
eukprot:COSAG04_NODE_624_length_11804_cov_36.044425_6_plen_126_part_00